VFETWDEGRFSVWASLNCKGFHLVLRSKKRGERQERESEVSCVMLSYIYTAKCWCLILGFFLRLFRSGAVIAVWVLTKPGPTVSNHLELTFFTREPVQPKKTARSAFFASGSCGFGSGLFFLPSPTSTRMQKLCHPLILNMWTYLEEIPFSQCMFKEGMEILSNNLKRD